MQFEISVACAECRHTKGGNTAPVTRNIEHANKAYQKQLRAASADFRAVYHSKHHKSSCKRPHHAGLIEKIAAIKRNKGFPSRKISRIEPIREMGEKSKSEHPSGITAYVLCVVIALRNKVTHYRTGDSADDVHQNRQKARCVAGEYSPGNMVYGHRENRNQLDVVCIQPACIGLHGFASICLDIGDNQRTVL